jgi:ribosome-binding ATPase YchF (GTP1/OBG family)
MRLTKAGIAGGELPVLHHRPECRRRAGAGRAPERVVQHRKPLKIIPTLIEFVDIAGLVKGAASG